MRLLQSSTHSSHAPHVLRFAAIAAALVFTVLTITAPRPEKAEGAFHFEVIDEVMFGRAGDPDVQYVEMRMLAGGQNITAHSILGYFNSDGSYGGDILEIPTNVATGVANGRWLMGTPAFATASGVTPDFTFTPVTLPSAGMICHGGGGGAFPLNPPTWTRTTMSNWVDCVPYGGYLGPPIKGGPASPFGVGDGTSSLTRVSDTDNASVDFVLACPSPEVNTKAIGFNHDNHINLPPARPFDDLTHVNSDLLGDGCGDTDDDNDGLSDADELSLPGPACPPATAATNPLRRDTDGDRFLDAIECTLGTNPSDVLSKPAVTACGPTGDGDADKIATRIETCFYNSNPASNDTDGDAGGAGARDGCEIASLNADRIVNVADQGALASAFGTSMTPQYLVEFDITKDGTINPADMGTLASLISPAGQCP